MKIKIGVTSGMRGYFAVKYDEEGPIQTSPITCKTFKEAQEDAVFWAKAEELPLDFSPEEV